MAWFRMRNGFNITNKTSARSCAGNSGQEFWRILEAFRRIRGGMGTDSVIDRVPALRATGAHAKEKLRVLQLECQAYAYEHGIDKPEMDGRTWPANK